MRVVDLGGCVVLKFAFGKHQLTQIVEIAYGSVIGFECLECIPEFLMNGRWVFIAVGLEAILGNVLNRPMHQIQVRSVLGIEVQAATVQTFVLVESLKDCLTVTIEFQGGVRDRFGCSS